MKRLLVVVALALAAPCLAFGQPKRAQPPKPVRYDGLYVCKQADYMKYLRFYKDGTVISETSSNPIDTAARYFHRGGSRPVTEAKYTITASRIQFTFQEVAGPIAYEGTMSANLIDFKVHSGITDEDSIEKYEFVTATVSADEPYESVVRAKTKVEGIELGQWVTEVVYYDQYGRPHKSDLANVQGVLVARRCRIFLATSLVQSHWAFPGPPMKSPVCDIDPMDLFFATNHDPQGNPKVSRFLCLDANGDVIMDGRKPLLIRSFVGTQKSVRDEVYNERGFKARAYVKIFPCSDCAKQTGDSRVVYVW